jgi:NAD(P)-dependent dehydrogenase (short-subunit alcohol dehydrogenase family)
MGVLAGKVVLVTGGGGGVGRACALLAAREGAQVVVNDLGVGVAGHDAGSADPAEAVCAEIRAEGGQAVANSESVGSLAAADAMVEQALAVFGRLDAVINPAGILRDRMLHKMSEADWDAVVATHLKGAFNVSRASLGAFRAQGAGAYVHFTSTSGLVGNLGQANYAAAKLGVVGLSRILAMEGAAKGVRSNVIAPFAWTRMVAQVPVTDEASAEIAARLQATMRPDQVAQLAVALVSDQAAQVTGQIFAVRGDEVVLFDQPRPVASVTRAGGWTPQTLLAQGLRALEPRFTGLEGAASLFAYDPP